MKRITEKLILTLVAIMMVLPGAFAQVDVDESFLMVNTDGDRSMFVEGGNWKITFSNKDSLNNEYEKPVQMIFDGALTPDSTGIYISDIDSLMFEVPEMEYAAGVFEIGEELFQYIVIVTFLVVQLVYEEDDRFAKFFGVTEMVLCAHFYTILSIQ